LTIQRYNIPEPPTMRFVRFAGIREKKVEKSGIFIERFCPNIQNSLK